MYVYFRSAAYCSSHAKAKVRDLDSCITVLGVGM